MMAERIVVLDSMAFMTGLPISMLDRLYTVPGVRDELTRGVDVRRFEYYLNAGLEVREPSERYLRTVEASSRITGDFDRLSGVDISLLALALELNALIMTDDYSIQNLAATLDITCQNVSEKGIEAVIRWQNKCTGCARIWEQKYDSCPVCGKPLRSSRIK